MPPGIVWGSPGTTISNATHSTMRAGRGARSPPWDPHGIVVAGSIESRFPERARRCSFRSPVMPCRVPARLHFLCAANCCVLHWLFGVRRSSRREEDPQPERTAMPVRQISPTCRSVSGTPEISESPQQRRSAGGTKACSKTVVGGASSRRS